MSQSEEERAASLELTLRDVLTQQGPLFQVAPTANLRRQAAVHILEATTSFLQQWDKLTHAILRKSVVRQVFSLLLAELGPGDAQVREAVLQILQSLTQLDGIQILLDFLPCCMPVDTSSLEEATVQVIDVLRRLLLDNPAMLLPVLGCLSGLTVAESGRSEAFQVAVAALPVVSENNLPVIVSTMFKHVAVEEEAMQAWVALRDEFKLLEQSQDAASDVDNDPLGMVAHVILGSFTDSTNGSLLVQSYIKILEANAAADESSGSLLLDLLVLLTLSERADACDAADRILDSWLATDKFPFDRLEDLLPVICGNRKFGQPTCLLYRKVAPSLLRLSIFLLLAPARGSLASETGLESVQAFIFDLHHRLDRELQGELVHSLLHLSEEAATGGWENKNARRGRKRRRDQAPTANFQRVIHESVHYVLKTLATTEPRSLVRFKHILTGRLTSTSYTPTGIDEESTKDLCAILSRLVESDRIHSGGGLDASEIMMLLQKLLFSSSGAYGRAAGSSTRVVRGLLLATELIRLSSVSNDDKDCIKQWVLRVLLPATRRMVDPELGSPGLEFLEAWMSGGDSAAAKDVFQHFKMILANTGLIQILAHYQQTRNKENIVLGYANIPDHFTSHGSNGSTKGKQREMVFCVNFFLRQKDMHCPTRWRHSAQWVFELVDTYLRMGRDKSTNGWVPNGWLQAAVELPLLSLGLEPSTKKQELAVEWINQSLSQFELSVNELPEPEGLRADIGELIAQSHDTRALKQLRDVLLQYALTFLIGIGLSASVLKNAFDHYKKRASDVEPDEQLAFLIHFQVLKIYDLRTKLETVDCLLSSLTIALCRLRKMAKRNAISRSKGERLGNTRVEKPKNRQIGDDLGTTGFRDESMLEETRLLAEVDFASSQIRGIDTAFFSTGTFFSCDVLWECLGDSNHSQAIRESLDFVTCKDSSVKQPDFTAVSRLLEFNTRLIGHLVSLAAGSASFLPSPRHGKNEHTNVLSCIRVSLFLVDSLPEFRKVEAASRSKQLHADLLYPPVARLATSFLRLLLVLLSKLVEVRSSASDASSQGNVLTFKRFLELFQSVPRRNPSLGTLSKSNSFERQPDSNSRLVEETCDILLDCLRSTDDALVANQLLEILSVLALHEKGRFGGAVHQASWGSLHTIYAAEEWSEDSSTDWPYAFRLEIQRFRSQAVSSELQLLQRALEGTILRNASGASEGISNTVMFRHGLLRHWALLSHSALTLSELERHFSHLISELGSFLDNLENAVDNVHEDEEKDTEEVRLANKGKSTVSAIPWLSGATFVDVFELLLHMIVGLVAVTSPTTKLASSMEHCGPYYHLDHVFRLFRSLIDVYQKRILVFPRKVTSKVSNACRFMLSATAAQLNRCVDWRNSQPILSPDQRQANIYDAGAMQYFQKLLDSMAANIAGRVQSLCEFWQSKESASQYVSKSTTLSYAAEKAARTIKNTASSHNLTPPVFDLEDVEDGPEALKGIAKGFHQLDTTAVRSKKRRITPVPLSHDNKVDSSKEPSDILQLEGGDEDEDDADIWDNNDDDDSLEDQDEVSAGSFGVTGGWGEEDSDDESTGMLNLQSSLPLMRTG